MTIEVKRKGDSVDDLQTYINSKYDNDKYWFVEEVSNVTNQQRVQDVIDKKEYLNGDHAILHKPSYKYNGKEFTPRKLVLNYAKTLLNFQSAFLLQHPMTITGNVEVREQFQKISKKGNYHRLNKKLLDKLLKYGMVAEYVYLKDGVIKSKIIDASEGYPVYDNDNELIAFVEAYVSDAITYYVVYTDKSVAKYDNNGGELRLTEQYVNLSGLPIVYTTNNELSDVDGRSELDDWISILDSMEDLISKYTDSFYKFMNPIPVSVGQQLKGEGLPSSIVGGGITLDDGSDFKLVSNGLDYRSFETLYKTMLQSLLDTSQTPAISMNKTDISNLSEVSIKLLFQLADIKASQNETYIRDGLDQRFDKIRRLLALQGIVYSDKEYDTLDVVFHYATPSNDKEIIENLKTLRELGGLSLESLIEQSPLTTDVQMEIQKIINENGSMGNNVGNTIQNDNV